MLKYIFPVEKELYGKLLNYNRLYAYPKSPELTDKNLIILDSGAFALGKKGKVMDKIYMRELNAHYIKYNAENIIKVSPDVFLDPDKTMQNYEYWIENDYEKSIKIVIQFRKRRIIDSSIFKQLEFYKNIGADLDFVFLAKPSMTAIDCKLYDLDNLVRDIKKDYNIHHVHLLGSGYDERDIRGYMQMNYIDSIDSTMYYVDAKRKLSWRKNKTKIKDSFVNIAVDNADYINFLVAGIKFDE